MKQIFTTSDSSKNIVNQTEQNRLLALSNAELLSETLAFGKIVGSTESRGSNIGSAHYANCEQELLRRLNTSWIAGR